VGAPPTSTLTSQYLINFSLVHKRLALPILQILFVSDIAIFVLKRDVKLQLA